MKRSVKQEVTGLRQRIQIPKELFELMAEYIYDHYDPEDQKRYRNIVDGLQQKKEAILRHKLYSLYKTSDSDEKKELARQMYLDMVGIQEDFRW